MNTWAPLFSNIVESSLWSEPDHVCKVFITLLAKKDADQVSRLTAYAIGKKCWPGHPQAEVRALDALKILSEPDTRRVEPQPYDGRRIQRVEDGWLILNGQFYEDTMRKINRRNYKTEKQAEYRARKKGLPMAGENQYVKAHGDGDQEEADRVASEGLESHEEAAKQRGYEEWKKKKALTAIPSSPPAA